MTSPMAVNSLSYVDHVIDRKINQYKPTLSETNIKTKCHLNQDHKDYQKKIKKCCEKEIPLECLAVYYMKSSSDYNYNELSHYMKALLKSQSYSRDIKVYILRILYVLRFFPSEANSLCKLLKKYSNYDGQYELKNLWKKTQFDKHVFNAIFLSLVRMPLETFDKFVTKLQTIEKNLHKSPTSVRKKPTNAADVVYICIPKLRAKHKDDFMWWVNKAQELKMKPPLEWDSEQITWVIPRVHPKVPEILLMFKQQMKVTISNDDVSMLNECKEEWKNTNTCATFSSQLPKQQTKQFKYSNKKRSDKNVKNLQGIRQRWRRFWGLDRSVWYPQTADGRKAPWCMTGTRESITISKTVKKQHVRYEKFHDEDKILKVFKIQHQDQIKWIYIKKHTRYETFLWYVAKTMKLVETSEDARYLPIPRQLMFTWNLETMDLLDNDHNDQAITFHNWNSLHSGTTIIIKLSTLDHSLKMSGKSAAVIEKPLFLPMLWRRHWNLYQNIISNIDHKSFNYAKLYVVLEEFSAKMSRPNSNLDGARFLQKGLLNPNYISQNEITKKLKKTTNDKNDDEQINNEISALYSLTDNIQSQSQILQKYNSKSDYQAPEAGCYDTQIQNLQKEKFTVIHTLAVGDCLYHAIIEVMAKLNMVPYHHQLLCRLGDESKTELKNVYIGSSNESKSTQVHMQAMYKLREYLKGWIDKHTCNERYFVDLGLKDDWKHLMEVNTNGKKGGPIEMAIMSYVFGINIQNIMLFQNTIAQKETYTPNDIHRYFVNVPNIPYRKYIPTIHVGFLSSNHYVGLYYDDKYVNEKHKTALSKVQNHINSNTKNYYLLVDGYAGTGKTKLAFDVCTQYQGHAENTSIFVLAPTNSAVVNFKQRYANDIKSKLLKTEYMTIHKFMYSRMYIRNNNFVGKVRKDFKDFKSLEGCKHLVIIVDEAYIMTENLLEDFHKVLSSKLKIHNSKRLVMMMGDPYQLSITKNNDFDVFRCMMQKINSNQQVCRLTLDHVYRQASNSMINKIATVSRKSQKKVLPKSTYQQLQKHIMLHDFKMYNENKQDFVKACSDKKKEKSIVLCRTNKERVRYNHLIRTKKYSDGSRINQLNINEPLIILNNVYNTNGSIDFYNSQLVNSKIELKKKDITLKTLTFTVKSESKLVHYLHLKDTLKIKYGNQTKTLSEAILLVDYVKDVNFYNLQETKPTTVFLTYAHAMTVFKAQGQQWQYVFVDIKGMNAKEYYTAITRAQCEVHVFKSPSKKKITCLTLTEEMLDEKYKPDITPVVPKLTTTVPTKASTMVNEIANSRAQIINNKSGVLYYIKTDTIKKYTFDANGVHGFSEMNRNTPVQQMISNTPTYVIIEM